MWHDVLHAFLVGLALPAGAAVSIGTGFALYVFVDHVTWRFRYVRCLDCGVHYDRKRFKETGAMFCPKCGMNWA